MLNLNRAQILGNLTRDPEMRYTPNGQAVSSFTVATNRKWKGRDGAPDGEDTQYHDIVVWGKQAEAITPMLKKGSPAFVEGRLQTRNWEGQDGVKRYKTEIIADNIIVLSSRSGDNSNFMARSQSNPVDDISNSSTSTDKKTNTPPAEDEIDIEEIPF
ncbi:MAG: single-stranded DNA-binding protein [Patescibacteria group bacterium]